MSHEPGPDMRCGRRALEGLAGVEVLSDLTWFDPANVWAIELRLTREGPESPHVPRVTNWFLLIDKAYPWGRIKVHPAKAGGIAGTFHHQDHNPPGRENVPWRAGDLCLATPVRLFGRHGHDTEPYEPGNRIRWYVGRALTWLEAAASGTLALPGEPFELPKYPGANNSLLTVAFQEPRLAGGEQGFPGSGFVELRWSRWSEGLLLVTRFLGKNFQELYGITWGENALHPEKAAIVGGWVAFPGPPLIEPWQGPATWGEVRYAFRSAKLDFDRLLMPLVKRFRTEKRHPLLLGCQIPERVGGPVARRHWQALLLPELATGSVKLPGFRPNAIGFWERDRREGLAPNEPVQWLRSENWQADELLSRGRFPDQLRTMKVTLIGCGALGSAVAELLARAGVERFLLLDPDDMQSGNFARHTLTLADLNQKKANALANRLSAISAHVTAFADAHEFPPIGEEHQQFLAGSELVLDCTGADGTLASLERFAWPSGRWFASMSIGLRAKRLFCFADYGERFPHQVFRERIAPWLLREREEGRDFEFPWEGIGCWHPVFPARADDVWLLAASAVKHLESVVSAADGPREQLAVFQQASDEGGFSGIRRVRTGEGE